MRRLAHWLSTTLTLCLVAGAGLLWGLAEIHGAGPLESEAIVEIPRGTGVRDIAETLADRSVIADPVVFRWFARMSGSGGRLQAGEYAFPAGASMASVLDTLVRGDTVSYLVTVPEGLTSAQIVTLLEQDRRLTGAVADLPREGSLLPESYAFVRGDTREQVLDRMRAALAETVSALWQSRAPDLPFETPEEAVVLASIVERETGQADERGLVASVFINRLRLGMPLDSDPTVIYGITGGVRRFDRPLTRRDIDTVDSPYNTYRHRGLPPGPIANPGEAALAAVLNPPDSPYLFFVADGTGGHAFAETLEEHNRNVAAWRRIRDAER